MSRLMQTRPRQFCMGGRDYSRVVFDLVRVTGNLSRKCLDLRFSRLLPALPLRNSSKAGAKVAGPARGRKVGSPPVRTFRAKGPSYAPFVAPNREKIREVIQELVEARKRPSGSRY